MLRTNGRAFTLIEILCVVAIIAILSAIAVPNYLESQTRAKIARVKSDMRTVAIALETYAVDHNRYPLGWFESSVGLAGSRISGDERLSIIWNRFTTPIAYITSIPVDPFIEKAMIDTGKYPHWQIGNRLYYWYESLHWDPMPFALNPDETIVEHYIDDNADSESYYYRGWHLAYHGNHMWMINSYGPSRRPGYIAGPGGGGPTYPSAPFPDDFPSALEAISSIPSVGMNWGIYEPTNGTNSRGHLIRTAKGDINAIGSGQ